MSTKAYRTLKYNLIINLPKRIIQGKTPAKKKNNIFFFLFSEILNLLSYHIESNALI